MKQMKILNTLKQISKAYTEGIYADTPANRKLGRVGMSYADYTKRLKEEKEKAADKKYYFVRLSDGEEFMLEEGATSQEKAIDLAINYATDIVKYNGYKDFSFNLEENIDNWTDEQIDTEKWDWFSIRAKKHGDKIEISVYNWNTHKYLRNDTLKREKKNIAQQAKREREKSDKEFQEKFGWMEELDSYIKNKKVKKEKLLNSFKERLKIEEENYKKAGKPEFVKLSRTSLFASLKKEIDISRKINSLKLAIEVLEKPFDQINLLEKVILIIPDSNSSKKEDLEEKANSIYLKDKKEVLEELLKYLPINKNELIKYINNY